ncbi:MAG: TRAP transporter large permease [Rhodoferax sp.]|jgi:C4-dicarboxylate transporter DctM subunit|uniref:TRAP transporter large permease n=1 Tax=Rhodoferax sp. TaxID=50421 RepID=UPI001B752076|nr:TRAP transporter large permease [Rhodoferax sp.]MBP8287158.1 TRAP transporter large permease [Rhodoferax sp.]MBP9149511.1 TRAP transporter large permease [Rhodoferax sp.]MBP9737861.1 TRAP transporter large permease [Rhodoferax sp.]
MSLALLVLVGVLVVGMLLRMPIGFSMLASGFAYLLVKGQDLGLVAEQVSNGLYNSYVLLAVPLFVFAANVMNAGTVSERIFDFCRILVGRMRGGLAEVDILVSVVFSGMSGSAIADAAGPGLVTIRQMLNKPEYPRGFAGAVVVASATIGPIIPPSIPMIIYALVSGASVGALFLAGLVPGLLMAALMMGVVHVIATRRNMPRDDKIPMGDWPKILFRGVLPLSLPIVLLGGIYSGAFTPTEAAAVAALHALILAGIVFRGLTWRSFWGVVLESTRGSAVITMILAGSFMLNYAFTAEGVPQAMGLWVDQMQLSRLNFLLMVNLMFLVLGCFLDVSVLLLVFVPMLLPAAKLLGIDLVHFGVLAVLNMMIGLITPPFGMLLFVTKALTGIPIGEMVREGWLFLLMLIVLLLLITVFPQIVLWLPQSMGYVTT